ncbi:DUF2993 domain-containing protein [Leucobacter sp. cx-42]|uniref:LmeA family phospholipid-binding protein n=1 Tax=unclassified Leucobacter TaxID=2621730 RepID=UPI00165DA1B6|nr:DUF2993 domain-containing protein [Leucobacter sp. cx-42]
MSERKKLKRGTKVAIGAAVGVVLLAGIGEGALRMIIPGVLEGIVRDELSLPADQEVAVDLGGSALWNAIRGGVGDVTVAIDDAPIAEGTPMSAIAHAEFVPFNPEKGEITGGTAQLTVKRENLGSIISLATSGLVDDGRVEDGVLELSKSAPVFGQDVTVSASIRLSIDNGDLHVEPVSVQAAGFDFNAAELKRATGSLFEPVIEPQTICVGEYLPAGIELTDLEFAKSGDVTLSTRFSPDILADPAALQPGTCP